MGVAYSLGIVLALTICGAASACHFHPGVTISFVVFRDFPMRKAIPYVFLGLLHQFVLTLNVGTY